MALFFTITLLISSLGLLSLLLLKSYEMRTGRLFMASMRPGVQRLMHATVLFVEYILPGLARRGVRGIWLSVEGVVKQALARAILFFENALENMLTFVRELMQPPRGGGQASQFLREVAEHKKKLLERPVAKRAIFDE
ncbi:MAG TPA: hypothetical protein VHD31_01795 [Candidatus Paceibacterota bacterium]|nr:hypothetical protein [Candidatus Paceibacterota bacterium]